MINCLGDIFRASTPDRIFDGLDQRHRRTVCHYIIGRKKGPQQHIDLANKRRKKKINTHSTATAQITNISMPQNQKPVDN
jgi:hypothetical protein